MAIQRDKEQFDRLWNSRSRSDAPSAPYQPGQNLRVDKALKELTRGRRLLDIGCGDGTFLSQLQGRFGEGFGIDIAAPAVNLALQKGVQARVLNLNTDPLPYPDQFFDAVTILSTLQYFYDPEDVLRECGRVLGDRGVLFISVPNMRTFWRIARLTFTGNFPKVSLDQVGYDGGTLHYFCYQDLVELLNRAGFIVEWAHGIYGIPRFISGWTDESFLGVIKREFLSAEIFIKAVMRK